jgi:2-polyprenyl-3-methyl-5-hydroxy-6-metoxy-1,4-benzoquinol methylase
MAIRLDPENNETRALFDLADFAGQRVLEIGCGDGRLTWRYAGRAAPVTAIDAFSPGIERALPCPMNYATASNFTTWPLRTSALPVSRRLSTA